MSPSNVIVIDHPVIQTKLSELRDFTADHRKFRALLNEIASLMVYEVTRDWPTQPRAVQTPLERMTGHVLARKVTLVPILRAGLGMAEGVLHLLPDARMGHLGVYRDEKTLEPVSYYQKLPPDIADTEVLLIDPMLATGGSGLAAVSFLRKAGVTSMKFVCLVAAPEGIAALHQQYPDVPIYCAAIDRQLNEKGYILRDSEMPGIGFSEPDPAMFHQTFQPHDLLVVLLLVVLEGVLSIDNALVLGLLARRLRPSLQKKALTYGLVGALVFRLLAVAIAGKLLQWDIVKLLGGAYLVYVAIKDLFFKKKETNEKICIGADGLPIAVDETTGKPLTEDELDHELIRQTHGVGIDYQAIECARSRAFWYAVAVIELTDIAFAIDSILAAIALVGPPPPGTPETALHPKLWVVVTGGMLGAILMRYAAVIFIRLLEKFPRFEISAYLLVLVIGLKLVADWYFNSTIQQLNFHDTGSAAFWIFWLLMAACFAVGFIPRRCPTT